LNMGGIVTRYGGAEAVVRALRAGADILLLPTDLASAIDAVVAAVRSGELTEERIDRSVRKILRAKADLGLHRERTVEVARVPGVVGVEAHRAVAREVAERSITLARDRDGLVPVSPGDSRRVLAIVYADDPDPFAGAAFLRGLEARFPRLETARLDADARAADLDTLLAAADSADL
ncbi:MAG: beta-N-acetylglucosaminidase, partial [Gemmatimonadetes bacterium]|nr:beta-N-acetylglucosaminidase [Gemmatimonadota bacterium]NIQ58403.1 beta-N-acetylglucosaminidase [Gemmatimonadota bacterium]NIU78617.1 beta-N-acetylglucosaminidase [Gammaproteobacteria bacterium]NIX47460.1 beta-N-acetylglucosaminidase [Gemmatimonadota bacterium]NIY11843.1 beta-N-acetylglucosaminidase [Gemmatimonadota bacterium]